ncbi:MAG: hypothetical protein IPJ98_31090 [Bryobacterales bacterium]|nr:hypothetical protein [Bryobacterales bacterium]
MLEARTELIAYLLLASTAGSDDAFLKQLLAAETGMRTDTQSGAQSGANGATSLATKGLAPSIFGWAVESGALDRSVDGTNVTFRGNVSGLLRAASKQSTIDILLPQRNFWNGISFAVTFDTSRGPQPGTLLANKQQVGSWSVRSEIVNRRDPSAAAYRQRWQSLGIEVATNLLLRSREFSQAMRDNAELQNILNSVKPELSDLDRTLSAEVQPNWQEVTERATAILDEPFRRVQDLDTSLAGNALLIRSLNGLRLEYLSSWEARGRTLSFIANGALLTADWTVTRDPLLPDLHTVTGVLEFSPDKARKHDLTLNGSASFYGSRPGSQDSRWRDTKVTVQYDIPLKFKNEFGAYVVTFAARWEHIPKATPVSTAVLASLMNPLSAADTATAPAAATPAAAVVPEGEVGVFQAKFTITVKNSGFSIPLSFTASNRKSLIQEKWGVGANVGITFNFDSFLSAFRP